MLSVGLRERGVMIRLGCSALPRERLCAAAPLEPRSAEPD
jgi:hypothetical protein